MTMPIRDNSDARYQQVIRILGKVRRLSREEMAKQYPPSARKPRELSATICHGTFDNLAKR